MWLVRLLNNKSGRRVETICSLVCGCHVDVSPVGMQQVTPRARFVSSQHHRSIATDRRPHPAVVPDMPLTGKTVVVGMVKVRDPFDDVCVNRPAVVDPG